MSCSFSSPPRYITDVECTHLGGYHGKKECKPGYKEIDYREADSKEGCLIGAWVTECEKSEWPEENKIKCALGDLNSPEDCNPQWCKNTQSGQRIITDYCKGDKLNTDERCRNYCNENPEACQNNLLGYCENNMDKNICKQFAFDNIGVADNMVKEYCRKNPGDTDICGCFNIPNDLKVLSSKGIGLKPQCNLEQCVKAGAYKTKAMLQDKTCPTVNICEQKLNIASLDKSQLEGVSFSCAQDTTEARAPREVKTSEKSFVQKIVSQASKTRTSNTNVITVIIAIIVLLLSISSLLASQL